VSDVGDAGAHVSFLELRVLAQRRLRPTTWSLARREEGHIAGSRRREHADAGTVASPRELLPDFIPPTAFTALMLIQHEPIV